MAKGNVSGGTAKAPVTEVVKQKKEKVKKGLYSGKSKAPFDTIPTDYDFKLHKPLKGKDFAGKAGFWEFKAAQTKLRAENMLAAAAALTDRAVKFRAFGDDKVAKSAKKLERVRAQAAALEKELAGLGFDTSKLTAAKV